MKKQLVSQSRALSGVVILSLALGLHSALADDAPEKKDTGWQSSAAAGLSLTRGNSDTVLATMSATTDRKWDQSEISLGADGAYGETKINGVNNKNAESAHGFLQYNRLITERFFAYARVDGLHDEVADIRYRVSIGPGAGYYFIKNKTTDLTAELGPGYVFEELGAQKLNYATLRVAEKLHHALTDRARIWQSAEWLPQVDNFKNYIINAEIGIEADITKDKKFSLRSFLQDTYDNVPAAGRKKNDIKLITALAYKF